MNKRETEAAIAALAALAEHTRFWISPTDYANHVTGRRWLAVEWSDIVDAINHLKYPVQPPAG